ncbi:MAG TPA: PAS domain S-box protein, partial [Pseudonocardiaceae bacterium]|nr:PAS domain S-box protein [Pseudonocardiaceae bacterium]
MEGKPVAERVQPAEPVSTGWRPSRPAGAARPVTGPALPELPDAPSLLVDRVGRIMRANEGAAAMVGADDPDKLVGRNIGDVLVGEGDRQRLTLGEGDGVPVRAVRWRVPTTGMDAVLLTDLSDLVDAKRGLAEERRRFADAELLTRMGWWEFDHDNHETFWSAGLHALLGVEPGSVEPCLHTMLEFIHPDDRDRARLEWRRHQVAGEALDIELRIVRRDGAQRWVHAVAAARRRDGERRCVITGYARDVTDRQRARSRLAEDRAALLDAQRVARMGSFTYDLATGHIDRSEALLEMYARAGVTPGQDPLAPRQESMIASLRDRLLNGPPGQTFEFEINSKSGDRIYVVRVRSTADSSGRPAQVVGTLQDVTHHRMLERQLLADRRRFEDAQRAARLGTWEWNVTTDQSVWSPMLYELFGVPTGNPVTHQLFLSLVHPQDRGWVEDLFAKLARDHKSVDCEYRLIRPDGAVRVFRCSGVAFSGEAGIIVGTAQDITEQRAAETRMLRSSQRFTDLVALTPVGIGLFDESSRLVDANDALCDLLGYGLEKLRGRTATQLSHPADPDTFASAIGAGQERGTHRIPQQVLVRSDGEPVYCELHVAVSVQDDGQRFWLVVFQDITERRRAAEALLHQATHDELTGLPNRAAVNDLLRRLLSGPTAAATAVLFCDIDNFKRVNDSLGHDAGDELLVALARRLEGGLPDGCTVARLSGDEYVIICPDIDAVGGVESLANRVSTLLRTAVPVHGQLVRVTATIGAAVPNGDPPTAADLLRFADAAMFEAKKRGAGRVAMASAALIASADRQVHLEGQLREAIGNDGLHLNFQPVVGPDGRILTAEALVRWSHPDRGMLAPDVFLPVAEQGGLLRELDRWVLRTALREAASWPAPGGRPVGVAVNLAGLLPGDPEFVDIVANAVVQAG